ncbi:serine--tRNA synthetase-like protein Slimp [Lucilia cuprina]|uniref:serine--tRNA synthetase-like protein Slimp n=1 Tax=Lucilia cuprina TaxID=7375 RepID=UPI001F06213B|nr:serine--tRNA synthetase-like protein Slimp [Lucilia cuprina]
MHRIIKTCSKIIPLSGNALKIRNVSALYITGDKASENYVTLQPYMDFKQTFENMEQLEHSVEKRKLAIDLKSVLKMFDTYREGIKAMDKLEDEREMIAKQLKQLAKAEQKDEELMNDLKEKGKHLRNDLRTMKTNFYPIEDEFIQAFLHLPNTLHSQCPEGEHERVLYRSKQQLMKAEKSHLEHDDLIYFIDNSRYYMLNEAAEFDIRVPQALTRYFLDKGNFIQTANPDFTRCVLLEANATPMDQYHKVMEAHLQNKLNAAYLTGGGSFESFLGAVTKLCVYPTVLPLKFVSIGRIYEKTNSSNTPNLFTATQNNAVQTFVATTDLQEAEEQMENILNLCVDFYKTFNVHFRVVYVNAAQLTPAESLRAQIEIYSPHEERYICVGHVSNYKDFVSKRILFTMRQQKDYHFLHMVGGPVLYTSRLIAALIEHGENLDYKKVLEALKLKAPNDAAAATNAMNEFKSLFK